MKAKSGVRAFSFIQAKNGKVELCLQNEDDSLTPLDALHSLIQGYWLPWESQKAASIQLGHQAPYFFTSALGGCGIYRNNTNPPKVSHVAGDGPSSANPKGSVWRDGKAKAEGMEANRRFSGLRDYGMLGFAIGYQKAGKWIILGQSIDINNASGIWKVIKTKEI